MFKNVKVETKVGFGVRYDDAEDMTKDGFTLLVMGYTGAKAMEFKLAYIKRFNEMEAELRNQVPQVPTNFAEALQLAADQAKQLEETVG